MADGIKAYARPSQGGVTIDVEAMIVDLITVYKASGHTLDQLQGLIAETWPQVEVRVEIPKGTKN